MNSKTILTLAAAAGAAFLLARKGQGGALLRTGDAERMGGIDHLYSADRQQTAVTQAAVQQNWRDLQNSVFRTQPDFWV